MLFNRSIIITALLVLTAVGLSFVTCLFDPRMPTMEELLLWPG